MAAPPRPHHPLRPAPHPALRPALRLTALLAAALLAGCATLPTAEITRFNIGQPIPAGSITVEASDPAQASGLEFRTHAAAVAQALAAIGFAPAADAAGTYVAILGVEAGRRDGPPRQPPLRIGIGGGGIAGGVGLGGGVSVPVGATPDSTIRSVSLSLRIRRRSDGSAVWEGRATQDLPARGTVAAAVPALARALLAGFPGTSGETLRVKTGA